MKKHLSKGNSKIELKSDMIGDSMEVSWNDCYNIYDNEKVSSRGCNKPFFNA